MDSDAIVSLTGSDFNYNYKEIPTRCSDSEIQNYISRTRDLFDPIARAFEDGCNTEWFIRSYLALKYVLSSTVLANSAEYSKKRNLQVTDRAGSGTLISPAHTGEHVARAVQLHHHSGHDQTSRGSGAEND
ncbi:hypothetical protein [Rhizobium sp. YS-1r]|uniref:hypothetical protein n=1 Tax=Rhizobium sp. YS-1r TaxID=1532558 RepID=UPI00050FEE28|nr:hypothetical protein [Rhizobium sp. YS-1r]KGE01865.1 hypothetical protein JL39_03650 [Rhizobium sp. YS-1r]